MHNKNTGKMSKRSKGLGTSSTNRIVTLAEIAYKPNFRTKTERKAERRFNKEAQLAHTKEQTHNRSTAQKVRDVAKTVKNMLRRSQNR